MTLFKREPRSVYRVYAEDDYLDGGEAGLVADGDQSAPLDADARQGTTWEEGRWSPTGLLAAGVIVVIALGVLAVVLVAGHSSRRRPVASATVASPRPGELDAIRPRRREPRPRRRRPRVHMNVGPGRRRLSRPVALVLSRPVVAAAPPRSLSASAAWLEFGFER